MEWGQSRALGIGTSRRTNGSKSLEASSTTAVTHSQGAGRYVPYILGKLAATLCCLFATVPEDVQRKLTGPGTGCNDCDWG